MSTFGGIEPGVSVWTSTLVILPLGILDLTDTGVTLPRPERVDDILVWIGDLEGDVSSISKERSGVGEILGTRDLSDIQPGELFCSVLRLVILSDFEVLTWCLLLGVEGRRWGTSIWIFGDRGLSCFGDEDDL